jgi:hypothetical protein
MAQEARYKGGMALFFLLVDRPAWENGVQRVLILARVRYDRVPCDRSLCVTRLYHCG